MKSSREKSAVTPTPGLAAILFSLGDYVLAIAASAVAEIQIAQKLQRLETSMHVGNVCNTLLRDGRQYWVVDTNSHFGIPPTRGKRLLLLSEMPVVLKVDSILRMAELPKLLPLPNAFQGEERRWYLGLAVLDQQVVPLINPASFLTTEVLTELAAKLPLDAGSHSAVVVA